MQIPKVVMTQALIDEYAAKYTGVNHAHQPYCNRCSVTLAIVASAKRPRYDKGMVLQRRNIQPHYFYIGINEVVYRGLFKNGNISYYHIACLDAQPRLKSHIEGELRQETIPIAVSP
jgi:hypothetical protein